MNKSDQTVVVGMSGGVDSSVTAMLLKQEGYRVIGLFMKNWEEESCPATDDYQDVIAVCRQLDIPFYSVNFAKEYWDLVFSKCLKEYEEGFTPNPDIFCNKEIKFNLFFKKALALGGDYLATGHYCQKLEVENRSALGRGLDENKDQSYFLYTMKSHILDKVLFPLGGMEKKEVRRLAEAHGLATAKKKDSTGICFIGKRNFKPFLSQYIKPNKGSFETLSGNVVGEHDGIAYYTIGQRKGLGIGGEGEAWYVVGKDVSRNVVLVEQGDDHPSLYASGLVATEATWVGESPKFPLQCTAKIRYRSEDVVCSVNQVSDRLEVQFDAPQKAVTPRQSIVFYQGPICLGGALIESSR